MTKHTKPLYYPQTANSAIYDAQAFSVGESDTVHRPEHFPNGLMIVAACGVYAWASEHESRIAVWRAGAVSCERCK